MKKLIALVLVFSSLSIFAANGYKPATAAAHQKGKTAVYCFTSLSNITLYGVNTNISGAYSNWLVTGWATGTTFGSMQYDTNSGIDVDVWIGTVKSKTMYSHIYVDGSFYTTFTHTTTSVYTTHVAAANYIDVVCDYTP